MTETPAKAWHKAGRWGCDDVMVYVDDDGDNGSFVADAATSEDAQRFVDWHNIDLAIKDDPWAGHGDHPRDSYRYDGCPGCAALASPSETERPG